MSSIARVRVLSCFFLLFGSTVVISYFMVSLSLSLPPPSLFTPFEFKQSLLLIRRKVLKIDCAHGVYMVTEYSGKMWRENVIFPI